MDGIFIVNKPIELTSRSVCNQIGKFYSTKRVGHVGTLDPFASGLLLVAINKGTKAVAFFDESYKEYEADISLGILTDTLDNTGKVVRQEEVKDLSLDVITAALNSFKGDIEQIPPMTSAIHVNGKRLYEYAHQGIEIERPSRRVHIHEIKLIKYDHEKRIITIATKVSKGTYIRTLGSDIATKLGTVGHLSRLVRTNVSGFDLTESSSLEDVLNGNAKLYSVSEILSRLMKTVSFEDKKIEDIKNGKYHYLDFETKEDRILVLDKNGAAIAVYQKDDSGKLKFVRGLF